MFYVKIRTKRWFTYPHSFTSNSCTGSHCWRPALLGIHTSNRPIVQCRQPYAFAFRAHLMFALSITPPLCVTRHRAQTVKFQFCVLRKIRRFSSPESESDSEELSSHLLSILRCCPPGHLSLTPFQFPCLCEGHSKFQPIFNEL